MILNSNGVTATIAALIVIGAAHVAQAHTPYLLPNAFDAERDHVTLQGSLTEDDYFSPDIAIKATSYVEKLPDGQTRVISPSIVLKDLAVIEALLEAAGTYRFSTGQFVARTGKMAEINGQWMMVRPTGSPEHREPDHASAADAAKPAEKHDGPHSIAQADMPAGAKIMQVESILTAETYVSKGAPTKAALSTTGKGLELVPITHPDSVYLDEGFSFKFLIDGTAAAGVPVAVYRSGNTFDEKKIATELKTDSTGSAKLSFDRPGIYLLTAHYPAARQAPGAAPPTRTYVYSLTFEVTR